MRSAHIVATVGLLALGTFAAIACAPASEVASASAADTTTSTTHLDAIIDPAAWGTCVVDTALRCSVTPPATLANSALSIQVGSALHSIEISQREAGEQTSSFAVRPESFPYTLTFTVDMPGVFVFTKVLTVTAPSSTPLVAKTPFSFWRVRVTNPDNLPLASWSSGTTGAFAAPVEARSADGYSPAVFQFSPPAVEAGRDALIPAPSAPVVGTYSMMAVEDFFAVPTTTPFTLEGPGIYEARATGLRRIAASFDVAEDAGAPDAH